MGLLPQPAGQIEAPGRPVAVQLAAPGPLAQQLEQDHQGEADPHHGRLVAGHRAAGEGGEGGRRGRAELPGHPGPGRRGQRRRGGAGGLDRTGLARDAGQQLLAVAPGTAGVLATGFLTAHHNPA